MYSGRGANLDSHQMMPSVNIAVMGGFIVGGIGERGNVLVSRVTVTSATRFPAKAG